MFEEKIYPGSLARYLALRKAREDLATVENVSMDKLVGLCVAEELAGLSYTLDKIRLQLRFPDTVKLAPGELDPRD